jgi:hypothetical protein
MQKKRSNKIQKNILLLQDFIKKPHKNILFSSTKKFKFMKLPSIKKITIKKKTMNIFKRMLVIWADETD